MPLDPLNKKYLAFNWVVIEFDGNDIKQIRKAFKEAMRIKNKPICLIANTNPGKGVSFMQGDFHWHGKAPNDEQLEIGLAQNSETLGDY